MPALGQKQLLVFISHANEDNAAARRLYKRLKADGANPWLDEENLLPGQNWGLEIEKALRASDVILLCFSEVSVAKSGYIQREYKRAMDILQEKPEGAIFIIPIRLDNCEMPNFIRELHWMDYPEDYDRLLLSLQSKSGGSVMPKKSETEKKAAPRKPAAPKPASGPVFNIQGGIHIGRDFVGGDQVNYINNIQAINNISSPTEFVSELQKLRAEIEMLKSQPNIESSAARRLTAVEGDIDDAIVEAEKEAPVAERIKSTLDGAKETMEKLGGSITSAVNLGTLLGNLALIAIKVFGG